MQCLGLEQFRVHRYRSRLLEEKYFPQFSKPNDTVLHDDYVASKLRARGYRWPESPRSIYDPEKLYEALSRYSPGKVSDPTSDVHLEAGYALAYACFAKPKGRGRFLDPLPLTHETVKIVTQNPSGSPGLTNYGHKKSESMEVALVRALETLSGKKAPEPCLAFYRTQFNGKTRLVWGFPYSETVIEGLLAFPLIAEFKNRNTPMAFAISTMALGVKMRAAERSNRYAYSLDVSAFDSTVSSAMIERAFNIVRTWFDPEQVEPTSGLLYRDILTHVSHYFRRCSIVMPDGNIYHGRRHGVPSGSFFTQLIDSMINVMIAGTIASRFNLRIRRDDILVLGDDLLMWSNRGMSITPISRYAKEKFGMIINVSKSEVYDMASNPDQPVHFLGRDWVKGIPDLPQKEILIRAVYPEKFRRYSPNPDVREREVNLLLFSLLTNYRSGWDIAKDVFGCKRWFDTPGACERQIFLGAESLDHVPKEFTSGNQRYRAKYVFPERLGGARLPTMATSFMT